jgi:hypothetical protein
MKLINCFNSLNVALQGLDCMAHPLCVHTLHTYVHTFHTCSNAAFLRMGHEGMQGSMKLRAFVGLTKTFSDNKNVDLIVILKNRIKSIITF